MDRFCRTTPLDLGRDLNSSGPGGDPCADPSVVTGLWASGSDSGEKWPPEAKGSDESGPIGSVHQVCSAGADKRAGVSGWYQSYWPMASRAISGMVGRAKGEPSRVRDMVWNGGCTDGEGDMTEGGRGDEDHVLG